jgi:regulator of sigma E protease
MQRSISSDVESSQRNAASTSQLSPYTQPVQTLSLLVSLSISLGIFNLFPFPALDGGRILFVLAEMLFRRRVPQEFENVVHGVGMAFLLLVMVYVNVRDFIDPISTTFP